MGSTSTSVAEKTAEDLRRELEELRRQQREITERIRDPRGLRRAGVLPNGPRLNALRQRGVVRPVEPMEIEEEPAPKRRLLSTVVKVGGEEAKGEEAAVSAGVAVGKAKDLAAEEVGTEVKVEETARRPMAPPGLQRDWRSSRINYDVPLPEPTPRVLPKDEDPSLVKRNKRMLGQLIGTLQKFQEEDKHMSSTEAFLRRSDSLKKAEQKAREESERLRQKEREQIVENRRRDLTLRARIAAKTEEKKLELLFLQWADHQKKLCNFLRTKAKPPIYYLPKKPLDDDAAVIDQNKEQAFLEWKSARRAEVSQYQKQVEERLLANVEMQLERSQNARNARRANNLANLQESMDKELETHQLEHGPKTRRIPGGTEEEEDVEDIAAAEDDLIDDVLGVDEQRRAEADAGNVDTGNDGISSKNDAQ